MVVKETAIRARQDGQTLTFQIEGKGTMTHSSAVRRVADQALATGISAIQVDLHDCTYMDSTFLGTLLSLKRLVEAKDEGEFVLVSPSPACETLLRRMGLLGVLPVVKEEPPDQGWVELDSEMSDTDLFKRGLVQAHQELAQLPGPNGQAYREVAARMADELQREETAKRTQESS